MRKRRALLAAGGGLLFLSAFAATLFLTFPREALLRLAAAAAGNAGFTVEARSASTRLPATVVFENVVLRRSGSSLPFAVDRAELGAHPVGLFFGAPLRVTLARGSATVESGSTLSFSRGKVTGAGLSSSDLSIPPESGFSFRLDRGEGSWSTEGKGGAGGGTLRFRELRIPLPKGQAPTEEALLRDVTVKYALVGANLRISSLAGSYEDTTVEGTGEVASLLGGGEPTVTAQIRVVNPLSGRVGSLFGMAAKNARNATFHLAGPLRSPRGELQLF